MAEEVSRVMNFEQLPYLETFVTAAELSSFTAAADALDPPVTQAAVSQRIQVLEQDLGVSLFQRKGGRVLLTEAGQRLHDFARRIFDLHRQARQAITGKETPVAGELSLAASSVPGEHLLPALLSAFSQRHPHVQVRATVHDTRAVLDQVEKGQAHLGLLGGKRDSPHLEYRSLASDELVLVVPPDHSWARRRRITLDQLAGEPLIVREDGSGSRWCLEQGLAQAGMSLSDLHVTLELGSNEAIKEAVLRGLGVAILSTRVLEKELQARQLHALQVEGLTLTRDMFVVWDRRRALPIPARLFLDLLEANSASDMS
jgi:DNA-binding transcriptional LysR family regulator